MIEHIVPLSAILIQSCGRHNCSRKQLVQLDTKEENRLEVVVSATHMTEWRMWYGLAARGEDGASGVDGMP